MALRAERAVVLACIGLASVSVANAANGAERMAELANGAPLHESGLRATLALLPLGGDASGAPMLGIETRSETVAKDDLAWIGSGARQDDRRNAPDRRQRSRDSRYCSPRARRA